MKSFIRKIKNVLSEIKKPVIVFCLCAAGAVARPCYGQGVPPSAQNNRVDLILPYSTLAANTASNLSLGWLAISNFTQTSITWSNNTLVTNTITISVTNAAYADIVAPIQKDVGIVISELAGIGTNTFTLARMLDTTTIASNDVITLVIPHVASGVKTISTNLPASWYGGFFGVRVVNQSWFGAEGWTNGFFRWGRKINAW